MNDRTGTPPERQKWREAPVAVGLLTQRDLDILGSGFRRAIPLEAADEFGDLIAAIDEAERRAALPGGSQDGPNRR